MTQRSPATLFDVEDFIWTCTKEELEHVLVKARRAKKRRFSQIRAKGVKQQQKEMEESGKNVVT